MFTLRIATDNAAFVDDTDATANDGEPTAECCGEIARILRELADRLDSGERGSFPLFDYNGNRVGVATLEN